MFQFTALCFFICNTLIFTLMHDMLLILTYKVNKCNQNFKKMFR